MYNCSYQCLQVAFLAESNCRLSLSAVIVEPGCGFCVAQVLDAIREVHQLVTSGLELVPLVEIEPGTIESLEEAIENLTVGVAWFISHRGECSMHLLMPSI